MQVRTALAQQVGDELELVVLHPDRRPLRRRPRRGVREALVDPSVGLPPGPFEAGRRDDVVVERPERRVGEALVVLGDLVGADRHRPDREAVVVERLRLDVRPPGPADPGALPCAQGRLEGGDEPARAALPTAVLVDAERKAVGDDAPGQKTRGRPRRASRSLSSAVSPGSTRRSSRCSGQPICSPTETPAARARPKVRASRIVTAPAADAAVRELREPAVHRQAGQERRDPGDHQHQRGCTQ